jgi:Fusaric acid resistance protein-like
VTAGSPRTGHDAQSLDDTSAAPVPGRRRPAWLDWLDATDPGLMRLRMATEVMLAIGVVLAAEWLFVRSSGALQTAIPARAPAALAAQAWKLNHALEIIAMMLGAILAMITGFAVGLHTRARDQLVTMLFLPALLLAALAVGLEVHVRVASLALLVVALTAGTYCRRFGPRGFMGGMLAFMGAFLGFFIQDYVPLAEFGWLAAEVAIAAAVVIAVHFAFFRPRPAVAVRRMQRSYVARAHGVAIDVASLYAAMTSQGADLGRERRAQRRLQRRLLWLNEAALLIDAQLDRQTAAAVGWSAAGLHQRLFDAEVGLGNVARLAPAIARRPLPGNLAAAVGQALAGIRDAEFGTVLVAAEALRDALGGSAPGASAMTAADRVLLHRFATSVTDFAVALRAFRLYPAAPVPAGPAGGEFQTQVTTFGGWLPGSSAIAGNASQERGGSGWLERFRLAPYARTAIQMGVAVTGAIIAGDAMSGRRFYWAVIAAFITFMGTNTAGEQLRKGLFRVVGTVAGVVVGALLAHLVGDVVWAQIVVVLIALFLGLYLFRVNYTFMTIGVTVMVSQLYVELGEFSNQLLLLRLGETAVGAGVAMLTVLLVLPLHIGRVARVAAREQVEALGDLIGRCEGRLADPASRAGSDLELRAAARRVDVAYQALSATVWPLRTPLLGRQAPRIAGFMATIVAARHYANDLLLDVSAPHADLDQAATAALEAAQSQLSASVAAVTGALSPASGDAARPAPAPSGPRYVRAASLFARAADALPDHVPTTSPQLALGDLQLLDGALAEAAHWAGVPVTDLDTAARAARS